MFLLLATGLPIAFAIGGVSAAFAIAFWGVDHLFILAGAAFSNITNINLIAIPLFVLMGMVMSYTGIADDLYECMYIWLGRLRGGLAIGTVLICTMFAAMTGSIAAAIITLATIALPSMLKRGYSRDIAIGSVVAGGLLGVIIPPSILMIVYSGLSGESIGRLYLGGAVPGLILSALYMTYIGVRSALQPNLCPALPPEEIGGWKKRLTSLKSIVFPLALILFVLGSIYSGIVTPVEASAVGATGAFVCAAIYRRLNWQALKLALHRTVSITAFVMWLLMAVGCFSSIYSGIGAPELAKKVAYILPGGGWGMLIGMQITLILAGMIMDDFPIIMIFTPVFVPIIKLLGFDTLWFGVLFMVNMQIALLSPPYGFALIYMRGAVPEGITMLDIYRSVFPFIGLQLICLILVMAFPTLAHWLPNLIIR